MPTKGTLSRVPEREQPLVLGHYTLHATGITVKGKPTFEENEDVGEFIQKAVKRSKWWYADWMRYTESRADWQDKVDQVQHVTGLSEKTCKNIRSIGAIDLSRRRDDVEFELHGVVAGMEPSDQVLWLDRARTEGWSLSEFRLEVRGAKRRQIIEGQAVLEGQYRIWMADPPWRYGDSGVISGSAYGKAEAHYDTMTVEDICKMPIAAHSTPNATLFLWVPVPLVPDALLVVEAWGYTYKSTRIWDKVQGMPSHYAMQITHEHLIIASRGDGKPDVPTPHEDSIFRERIESHQHSEKPNRTLMAWIEKHWTIGPYCSLFASVKEPGFDNWAYHGSDARLWPQEVVTA